MSKTIPRYCKIFNCDRRHGNYCCEDCGYKANGNCKNYCQNGPNRCGQVNERKQVLSNNEDWSGRHKSNR